MKKKFNLKWLFLIVPVILIVIFVIVANLINSKPKEVKKVNYLTKDNRVVFTFSEDFIKKESGEYDLYTNKNDKQIFGAFTYNLSEYEENSSKEILDKQISYFLQQRKNSKIHKKESKIEMDDKTITRIEYLGKSDKSENCVYIFSVIDFKADPNYVVYVCELILESEYEKNIGEMIDILKSAKLN